MTFISRIAAYLCLALAALLLISGAGLMAAGATWGFSGAAKIAAACLAVAVAGTVGVVFLLGAVKEAAIKFGLMWLAFRKMSAGVAADERTADFYTLQHPTAGAVAIDRGGRFFLLQQPTGSAATGEATPQPAPAPEPSGPDPGPLPNVLEYIGDSQSLILLGPQGTGKTTLMSHIIDERAADLVAVVDPHGYEGKYPAVASIIGAGRNYDQIENFFTGVISEMHDRYREYNGRNQFPPMSIFVDEFTLIGQNCPAAKQFMESALTEFRKVRMRFVLCLHSRRAKFLGLAGAMDLAEGVDFCLLKKLGRDRWAEVDLSGYEGEPIKCCLPGPYTGGPRSAGRKGGGASGRIDGSGCHGHGHGEGVTSRSENAGYTGFSRDATPRRDTVTGLPYHPGEPTWAQCEEGSTRRIFESKAHKIMVEMSEAGASLNEIARKIWGASNGRRTRHIRDILSSFGIS